MKLWHKIALAPVVAVAFLLAAGGISYAMLSSQSQVLQEMYQQRFADYERSAHSSLMLGEVHSGIYRLLTWISNLPPDRVRQTIAEQERQLDMVKKTVREFAEGDPTEEEKKLTASLVERLDKYRANITKAVELSTSDVAMGAMLMQNADGVYQEMRKELDRLIEIQRQEADTSYHEAEAALRRTLLAQGVLIALAIAISAGVAWATTRSIVRPLKAATRYAGEIAGGDLTGTIAATSRDETGDLVRSLAGMNAGLAGIVAKVRAGTDAISTGSGEIAAGHRDLSRRTEEQASSLEETAASMEELTGTVKQNADNARQANELAQAATEVAARGGSAVGEVVDTMGSISGSSKKIAEIIAVIDGIAFQTNILALNAAVEAARAGEQGRGFAVVAAEVRSLAQRCAAAAREIRELIDDSAAKVDAGSRLVAQAGATMQEVVDSIRRVSGLMAEISAASSEQTRGIEQVNVAITQMDRTTQQNAALVEQASAAAQAMRDQAGSLVEAVSAFRLAAAPASAPTVAETATPVVVATAPAEPPTVAARAPLRTPRLERRREPALAGAEDAWDEF